MILFVQPFVLLGEKLGPLNHLGKVGQDDAFVRMVRTDYDQKGNEDVSLEFLRMKGTQTTFSKRYYCGPSQSRHIRLVVESFTGSLRQQVFVSINRTCESSFVLDFNGKTIKSLYRSPDANRRVHPRQTNGGKLFLEEFQLGGKGVSEIRFSNTGKLLRRRVR